jgi:hypothetical protein
MAKDILIHDPARRPSYFAGLMGENEAAVFHYDLATGTMRTASGRYASSPEENTALIFDSAAEAESYCRVAVEANPALFCKIFDRGVSEGRAKAIYPAAYVEKEFSRRASKRKVATGVGLILISALCVLVDWKLGGPVILGVVVGSKFLWQGLNRVVEGMAGLRERRAT